MQTERIIAARVNSMPVRHLDIVTCPDLPVEHKEAPENNIWEIEVGHAFLNIVKSPLVRGFGKWTRRAAYATGYLCLLTFKTSSAWLFGNSLAEKADWIPRANGDQRQSSRESDFATLQYYMSQGYSPSNFNFVSSKGRHETSGSDPHIASTMLEEMNILNQRLWGKDPDPTNLIQGGVPNCQIMGGGQSLFLTPQLFQTLKNAIEVTRYNLSDNEAEFLIDSKVYLSNGDVVEVPFADVVKWMSQRDIVPSQSKDGALGISILAVALQKYITENYEKTFPPTFPSVVPILLTGIDYSVIGVSPFYWNTLSDDELIELVSKAPKEPILVGSWGDFESFFDWIGKKILRKKKPFEFLPQSDDKAHEFITDAIKRTKEISTGKSANIDSAANPQNNTKNITLARGGGPGSSTSSASSLEIFPTHHIFVVKEYDPKTKRITVIDSHNKKYPPLTINEFRKVMGAIVAPTKHIPRYSTEALKAHLLFLAIASVHLTHFLRSRKKNNVEPALEKLQDLSPDAKDVDVPIYITSPSPELQHT